MVECGVLHQQARGDRVGDVEREIAGFHEVVAVLVVDERGEVAQQQSVGSGFFDELEVAGLAGLEDARGGEMDGGSGIGDGGFEDRDGIFVAARVFEIAVEGFQAGFDGGVELVEVAAEDGEGGISA